LKTEDYIALPREIKITNPQNTISDDELILIAHLLGDGCILPNQPFHYTNAFEENIESVKESAKRLFRIEGRIVKQDNWYHIYLPSPYKLARNKKHPITNWFNKIGIKLVHSWEKEIPEAVFSCDSEKIYLFLKNLWSTDGNLSWKEMKGRTRVGNIYYSSTSKKMIEQIQHLLLMLGIQSTIRINAKKGYRETFCLYIEGSYNQLKFINQIGITDRRKEIIPELRKSLEKIIPNPNNDIIPKEFGN
jgi:replicative DNA helicase